LANHHAQLVLRGATGVGHHTSCPSVCVPGEDARRLVNAAGGAPCVPSVRHSQRG
jgi:hypothetical protein